MTVTSRNLGRYRHFGHRLQVTSKKSGRYPHPRLIFHRPQPDGLLIH